MTTATIENTLDSAYFIPSESTGAKFPALQISQYKMLGLNDKLSLVLDPDALELMDLPQSQYMGLTTKTCLYFDAEDNRTDKEMLAIEPSTRWIVLHRPATNYVTSPTGIRSLQAGDRFTEMGLKSVARVFLAAINNGNLILNSEGAPQIFTWKLNSMKTNLIAGKDKDLRTMTKLNDALCKAYKVPTKNWLTHLVSLSIEAFPDTFKSSIKGASIGSNFRLVGDAIKLNPAHQKLVFDLATSDDFKALCADPFGLAKREAPIASIDPCRSMPSSYDEEIGF